MKNNKVVFIYSFIFMLIFYVVASGNVMAQNQCKAKNTAFSSGETLRYNLFFNWKFIWIKVGTASMNISETVYQGIPSYRAYLITRGSKTADKYFIMRDTLKAYVSKELQPIYATKHALEGKSYTVSDTWYKYDEEKILIHQRYQNKHGEIYLSNDTSLLCVYDMLSMLLRARSFEPETYKVGHRIRFVLADGKKCKQQELIFHGREIFKMDNSSTKYRCLVFSYVEKNKEGKEEEIVRFFVTDDKNHLPVRLDMNLKFGSAKAFLIGATGIRNPQTSKIK